jgi:DNA-binding transcriptional MerR regulator
MVNECPQIALASKYGVVETAALLGISKQTLLKYSNIGSRAGGIDFGIRKSNGRKFYTGKQIINFWQLNN